MAHTPYKIIGSITIYDHIDNAPSECVFPPHKFLFSVNVGKHLPPLWMSSHSNLTTVGPKLVCQTYDLSDVLWCQIWYAYGHTIETEEYDSILLKI